MAAPKICSICRVVLILQSFLFTSGGTSYALDLVEDWVPWKVALAVVSPVVCSVAGTIAWWFCGGGGGGLIAFQVGFYIALMGWGVVGVLLLLS